MLCPQNIIIDGISSNVFWVEFTPLNITDDDKELLFIEAILSALMDVFGNNFKIIIIPGTPYKMQIQLLEYCWLVDIAFKLSNFQEQVNEFIQDSMKISISIQKNYSTHYELIAKDGFYISKTKQSIIKTLSEDDIPLYKYQVTEF
jgi:hypothetical protein